MSLIARYNLVRRCAYRCAASLGAVHGSPEAAFSLPDECRHLGTAAVCQLINLILPKRYPRGWFTNVFPGAGSALQDRPSRASPRSRSADLRITATLGRSTTLRTGGFLSRDIDCSLAIYRLATSRSERPAPAPAPPRDPIRALRQSVTRDHRSSRMITARPKTPYEVSSALPNYNCQGVTCDDKN